MSCQALFVHRSNYFRATLMQRKPIKSGTEIFLRACAEISGNP